jgi:hypothetical protein
MEAAGSCETLINYSQEDNTVDSDDIKYHIEK